MVTSMNNVIAYLKEGKLLEDKHKAINIIARMHAQYNVWNKLLIKSKIGPKKLIT